MAQHSLLGASGASRWLACPGSFALSRTAKPSKPSIYAATGTVAHELIEEACNNKFQLDRSVKGTTRNVDGVDVLIDQEMIDSVEFMLKYARTRTSKTGNAHPPSMRLYRAEMKVYPKLPIDPPVEVFGSLDLIIADPEEHWFEVIDYKHGAGVPVKAERNAQLLYYAAGALAALHKASKKIDFREVILTVVQPRVPGASPIKQWTIDVLDLELWVADVLVPGIEACLEDNAPLNPGEHCRFCPALASCPALLAKAQEAAKQEFGEPLTIAEQLDLAAQVEVWIEALRKDALAKIEGGEHIAGWRSEPTRATRRWKDEAAVETILRQLILPSVDTHHHELLSPAQMHKALGQHLRRGEWDTMFGPQIEAHSSGTKLARTENDDFDLLEILQ